MFTGDMKWKTGGKNFSRRNPICVLMMMPIDFSPYHMQHAGLEIYFRCDWMDKYLELN